MTKGSTIYNLTYIRPPKKEKVAKAANGVKPKPAPGPKAPPPSVPKPIIKEIPPIEGKYHIAFEAGKTDCNFMQKEVDAYNILKSETNKILNFNDQKIAGKFINDVNNNYNNLPFINLDTNIPYYTYIEKHIEIYNGPFVGQKKKIETVNELYKIIKKIITTLSVFRLKVNENFLTRQNIKGTIVCGTPTDVQSAIDKFNAKKKLNGGKRKYTKRKIAAPKKKLTSKPTFTKLY